MGKKVVNKKKKGFTLIELIIVIAIIAILAAIAIPKFATIRHNANVTTDIANAKNIHSVVAQKLADETAPTVIKNGVTLDVDATTEINGSLDAGGTKCKTTGKNFYAEIDANGDVAIYAGTGSDKKQVYPTADPNTFQKK